MEKLKIKICGMKNENNLKACLELNPEFIGIIDYPKSPRYLDDPKGLLTLIPNLVSSVAVCVNPTSEDILRYQDLGFTAVQFSGNESLEQIKEFRKLTILKFIKSVSVDEIENLENWKDLVDYIIIDNKSTGFGGTGHSFDWNKVKELKIPFFLSGGLSLQKIDSIIEFINANPFCIGLDLNSGFEIEPGLKDIVSLNEFIKRVHELRS